MKNLLLIVLFLSTCYLSQGQEELCTRAERSEIYSENDVCEAKASNELLKSLEDDLTNFQFNLCKSITAKNKCQREILPKCLRASNVTRFELYILDRAAQRALNESVTLGEDFLFNCPIFQERLFEPYMIQVTGLNKCKYIDFTRQILPDKKKCDRDIRKDLDRKLEISRFLKGNPRVTFIENAYCEAYTNWNNVCTIPYINQCFGPEITQIILDNDEEFYAKEEKLIQEYVNPRFRFKTSCSGRSVASSGNNNNEFSPTDEFDFTSRKKRAIVKSNFMAEEADAYFNNFFSR